MKSSEPGIGTLRERVTVQASMVTVDANGDPTIVWSDVTTVWAKVESGKGQAYVKGERLTVDQWFEVTIRYRTMSATNRLVWRGQYLQIMSLANPDNRKRFIDMMCVDYGTDAGAQP